MVSYSSAMNREPVKTEEAAPAAQAPAAALADAVAETEEGIAEAKSITAPAAGEAAEPAENRCALNGMVYLHAAQLPAEAAVLLEAFTPMEQTETAVYYQVEKTDYTTLQDRLADAGISYLAEDGIDPTTDLVLIILSK